MGKKGLSRGGKVPKRGGNGNTNNKKHIYYLHKKSEALIFCNQSGWKSSLMLPVGELHKAPHQRPLRNVESPRGKSLTGDSNDSIKPSFLSPSSSSSSPSSPLPSLSYLSPPRKRLEESFSPACSFHDHHHYHHHCGDVDCDDDDYVQWSVGVFGQ